MTRRQALRALCAAIAVAGLTPGRLWAESPDELVIKGQDLLNDGNIQKALTVLLEARQADPGNERVHALLGRAWFQQGDVRAALESFREALRINPDDTLSRMMVDTITQFPLPGAPGPAKGKPRQRSSALARQAEAERRAVLEGKETPAGGRAFRLLLDPGHGGADIGCQGGGLKEKDVALDVALRLARALAAGNGGVEVFLTRTADVAVPGWARAALAGFYGADLLLSVHAGCAGKPEANGLAVYAYDRGGSDPLAVEQSAAEGAGFGGAPGFAGRGGEKFFADAARQAAFSAWRREGKRLAESLAAALPPELPLARRGAASGPFPLLGAADAPAVLVMAGFLSNKDDAAVLADAGKRAALAEGLASAVVGIARRAEAAK